MPSYTIENALTDVGNTVRGYLLTGRIDALLDAAKTAHERHQAAPRDEDEGTALAQTLLIAAWAHYAKKDPDVSDHDHFLFEAYGHA